VATVISTKVSRYAFCIYSAQKKARKMTNNCGTQSNISLHSYNIPRSYSYKNEGNISSR
jgi:hypothetical protein